MDILIVDDDPIGLYLAERIVKRQGFFSTITSFQSSVEALRFFRQRVLDGRRLPHVILLDLNMPLMDGWDFLEALKPLTDQLQNRSYICLLTSSVAAADIDRAQAHPLVEAFLSKPLKSHEMQKIYEKVRTIRTDLPTDPEE